MAEKTNHKRNKATVDRWSLWLIHIILILACVFSICKNYLPIEAEKGAGSGAGMSVSVEVKRGEQSMNGIYVMYGIATIAITLAVQVAETAKGYKSGLVIMDYAILTYLFFFNLWLRNWLIKIISTAISF